MKAKTLIACAFAAAALPPGSSWATQPTGPQGTGWYRYDAATFAQLDRNGDGVISRDEYPFYSGHSADTNPPAPAP